MSAQSPILMFGAYVSNLSVSLVWGGQGGSMQLTLVEDPANGVVIPKDSAGRAFTGAKRQDADGTEHIAPPTGTACYFKYRGFYFGGIFQRWTYKTDATQGSTYDVILESPSKLMDGVQLIVENFNGATDSFANSYNQQQSSTNEGGTHSLYGSDSVGNVYNLFAYFENPIYGKEQEFPGPLDRNPIEEYNNTSFENFGTSRFNSSGSPARELLYALSRVAKIDSGSVWGGPIKFGVDPAVDNTITNYGITEFNLQVAEIEDIYRQIFPGQSWIDILKDVRISGPVISVNQFMSELSTLHQWDYFYNIEPVGGQDAINQLDDGGSILLERVQTRDGINPDGLGVSYEPRANIKVKTVNRSYFPNLNRIKEFIDADLVKPDDEKVIMSYSIGREMADVATQKIVWGGRRSRYIEVNGKFDNGVANPSVGSQLAVWGRRNDVFDFAYNTVGTAAVTYGLPFANLSTGSIVLPNGVGYTLKPFELRMALAGKQAWEIYKTMETISGTSPQNYNLLTAPWTSTLEPTVDLLNLLINGAGNAFDLMQTNLSKSSSRWQSAKSKLSDEIFNAVSNVANQSYKQEYLVFLPNEVSNTDYNIYYPEDESEDSRTWRVSDSAFITPGVFAPSVDPVFFDGSGKMKSIMGYPVSPFTTDFSALGSDYGVGVNGADGTIITKSGGVADEDRWYGFGSSEADFGTFAVLCKGPKVKVWDGLTTPDFGLTVLSDILLGVNFAPAYWVGSGKSSLQFAIPPDLLEPSYIGIPQESERFNYGPWVSQVSLSGKAEAIEDNQLVPETYGSYSNLLNVGNEVVRLSSSAVMHQSESGYVQVHGAPDFNIGAQFASTGPYVTGMDISVDATGGVTSSYKFNTWTAEYGKLAKYNIDRIAKINKNSWTLAQKLRGRITKPPFPTVPFEKTDFSELQSKALAAYENMADVQFFFNKQNENQQEQGNDLGRKDGGPALGGDD